MPGYWTIGVETTLRTGRPQRVCGTRSESCTWAGCRIPGLRLPERVSSDAMLTAFWRSLRRPASCLMAAGCRPLCEISRRELHREQLTLCVLRPKVLHAAGFCDDLLPGRTASIPKGRTGAEARRTADPSCIPLSSVGFAQGPCERLRCIASAGCGVRPNIHGTSWDRAMQLIACCRYQQPVKQAVSTCESFCLIDRTGFCSCRFRAVTLHRAAWLIAHGERCAAQAAERRRRRVRPVSPAAGSDGRRSDTLPGAACSTATSSCRRRFECLRWTSGVGQLYNTRRCHSPPAVGLQEVPKQQRPGRARKSKPQRAVPGAASKAAEQREPEVPSKPRFGALTLRAVGRCRDQRQHTSAAQPAGEADAHAAAGAAEKATATSPAPGSNRRQGSPPSPSELPTPSAALQTPLNPAQRPGRRWSPQHLAAQVSALL